jgi:hypothetical protein
MIKRILEAAALPALLLTIALAYGAPAAAADMDFCSGSTCKFGQVQNGSTATVVRVKVSQLGKDGCSAVEKTHEKNMPGGLFGFRIKIDPTCTYHVKYQTTKGCIGNKDKKITPTNIAKGKTRLILDSLCGTLVVKQLKYKGVNGSTSGDSSGS